MNRRLVGGSVALLLALAQFRLIVFVFSRDYLRSVQAAVGVVDGRPHWRLYQSRVLGPYAMDGLSHVLPSAVSAHAFLSVMLLAVAGWQAFRLGSRWGDLRGGVVGVVVLHACFALLLDHRWLYLWDFIDLCVFLAFVELVINGARWPRFVALWAIGILNHEIAVFIAAWLVVDPVARWALGKRGRAPAAPLDRTQVLIGIACVVASALVVEALRRALFIEEIGPKVFLNLPPRGSTVQFMLLDNLAALRTMLTHVDYSMPIVVPVFLAVVISIVVALARREPTRFAGLALVHLVMIGALCTFGVMFETRIYIVLIPIVVVAVLMPTPER